MTRQMNSRTTYPCFLYVGLIGIMTSITKGTYQDQYIGCFYGNSTTSFTAVFSNGSSSNIQRCIQHCQGNTTLSYAALKNGTVCSCGDEYGVQVSDENCNLTCSAVGRKTCTGVTGYPNAYALFSVCPTGTYGSSCENVCHCKRELQCTRMTGFCPNGCHGIWTGDQCNSANLSQQYIGCFRDDVNDRALSDCAQCSDDRVSMTIESCIQMCSQRNRTYAGAQYHCQCFCGETYIKYGQLNENNCSTPCTSNPNEICGGAFANSVYLVCPAGNYGNLCAGRCHCPNGGSCVYSSGSCLSPGSLCESGWKGSSCNIRDCGQNNGNCFSNETCYNITLNSATIAACRCSEGYQRTTAWTNCTDLDECSLSSPLCDSDSATCNNTIGSFQCTCKEGYTQNGTTSCIDIDECESSHAQCDSNSTNCNNTRGGYECNCRPGYSRTDLYTCTDIDECQRSLAQCDTDSTICINTVGGYECSCKTGYIPKDQDKYTCKDIDECTSEVCENETTSNCINTLGSFHCDCLIGYASLNGSSCRDVDECEPAQPRCDAASTTCNNSIGSYECQCKPGYVPKDKNFCIRPGPNDKMIIGAVIGSVVGFLVIVSLVCVALYYYRRIHGKQIEDSEVLSNQSSSISRGETSEPVIRGRRVQSIFAEKIEASYPSNALNTVRSKLSDRKAMQEEFQAVPLKTKDFCAIGTREEVRKKNRFLNIIPYEWNRVALSRNTDDDTSQYINASYVQGYSDSDKFIAGQGPRDESLEDFWRMIVEKEVCLIVMITNLVENQKTKCAKYWPDVGESVDHGDVTVTLLEEDAWPNYKMRHLKASNRHQTIEVRQWHYLAWPDHGVPTDIKCFLSFHRKVRHQMQPDKYTLVHCSAGAGRTGTFLAIDFLLEQEKIERDVDVNECLKNLREQRSHMIQNLVQYEFVHYAIMKAFLIGNTSTPVDKFTTMLKVWQDKDRTSGKTVIEVQWQDIEEVNLDQEESTKYRVWARTIVQSKVMEMDAVYIHSWKYRDTYISTKLLDSPEDIWNLRREQNSKILIFVGSAKSSTVRFLPTKTEAVNLKSSTLICQGETKEVYGWRLLVAESKMEENTYENIIPSEDIYENSKQLTEKTCVTVFYVEDSVTTKADRLLVLRDAVESLKKAEKNNSCPVTFVSESDRSLTGFCIALFNALEMIQLEQEADIYQIVMNIRKSKPELFNSMTSYVDLYKVVETYIKMSTV